VQISGARANIVIDPAFQNRVAALLDAEKLPHKQLELQDNRLLIRFADPETSSRPPTSSRISWAATTSLRST
jgi:hypothetical protein